MGICQSWSVDYRVATIRYHVIFTPAILSILLSDFKRIDKLRVDRDADVQNFVGFITNETTQKNINNYLKMLSTRKNK